MAYFSNNGSDLYYSTMGDGPPVMLIAGFSSDSASWAPVTETLARHYKLILLDNRGTGRSQEFKTPLSFDHYTEDCIGLLDHLGLRSASFIGHSMGGMISLKTAAVAPDRVDKLILAASAPATLARSRSVIEHVVALRESGVRDEQWLRSLFHWLFGPDFFEDPRAVDAGIAMSMRYPYRQTVQNMRAQCDALSAIDLSDTLCQVNAETLFLLAEHDLLFPPEKVMGSIPQTQPQLQSKILPGAGHSLHWDQPAAFSEAVIEFIGK